MLALAQRGLAIGAPPPDADAPSAATLLAALREASALVHVHRDLEVAWGELAGGIAPSIARAASLGREAEAPIEDVADDGFLNLPAAGRPDGTAARPADRAPGAAAAVAHAGEAIGRAGVRSDDEVGAVLAMVAALQAVQQAGVALKVAADAPAETPPAGPAPTDPAPPVPHRRTTAAHRAPDVLSGLVDDVFSLSAFVVQGAVSMILAVVVGYTVFLGNWTGTLGDMAAVLTWALGVDLSINALVAYRHTLKDPGPKYDPAAA